MWSFEVFSDIVDCSCSNGNTFAMKLSIQTMKLFIETRVHFDDIVDIHHEIHASRLTDIENRDVFQPKNGGHIEHALVILDDMTMVKHSAYLYVLRVPNIRFVPSENSQKKPVSVFRMLSISSKIRSVRVKWFARISEIDV